MSSPSCTILLFDAYQLSVCVFFSLACGYSRVWKRTPYFYCLLKPRQYFRFVCSSIAVNTMIAKKKPKNSSTTARTNSFKIFSFLALVGVQLKGPNEFKEYAADETWFEFKNFKCSQDIRIFFFSSYSAYFVNIPCQQNYQLYGACIRKSSWFLVNAIYFATGRILMDSATRSLLKKTLLMKS